MYYFKQNKFKTNRIFDFSRQDWVKIQNTVIFFNLLASDEPRE